MISGEAAKSNSVIQYFDSPLCLGCWGQMHYVNELRWSETWVPQITTDVFGIDNRKDSQITIPKDSYENQPTCIIKSSWIIYVLDYLMKYFIGKLRFTVPTMFNKRVTYWTLKKEGLIFW